VMCWMVYKDTNRIDAVIPRLKNLGFEQTLDRATYLDLRRRGYSD
jgi:hypothetical protein